MIYQGGELTFKKVVATNAEGKPFIIAGFCQMPDRSIVLASARELQGKELGEGGVRVGAIMYVLTQLACAQNSEYDLTVRNQVLSENTIDEIVSKL